MYSSRYTTLTNVRTGYGNLHLVLKTTSLVGHTSMQSVIFEKIVVNVLLSQWNKCTLCSKFSSSVIPNGTGYRNHVEYRRKAIFTRQASHSHKKDLNYHVQC